MNRFEDEVTKNLDNVIASLKHDVKDASNEEMLEKSSRIEELKGYKKAYLEARLKPQPEEEMAPA